MKVDARFELYIPPHILIFFAIKVKKMEEEMEEVFCKKVEEKHARIEKSER